MNKKGFVLAETLVVTIFVLLIFTILYNSAVPLLGRYRQLLDYNDIDSTYDLYHIRNLLKKDTNYNTIMSKNFAILKCAKNAYDNTNVESIANYAECNNLYAALGIEYSTDIDIKDEVIYLKKSAINQVKNHSLISMQIKDYLDVVDLPSNALILQNDGKVSYIDINPDKNASSTNAPSIIFTPTGTAYSTGFKTGVKIRITCSYSSGLNSFSTTLNGASSGTAVSSNSTTSVREITVSTAGTGTITATCKGANGKEISKTMTYSIFN